jgi:hypothetical protein
MCVDALEDVRLQPHDARAQPLHRLRQSTLQRHAHHRRHPGNVRARVQAPLVAFLHRALSQIFAQLTDKLRR